MITNIRTVQSGIIVNAYLPATSLLHAGLKRNLRKERGIMNR